jgi:hypothetical protein
MRLIANFIVTCSLCLIVWSGYTLYRKARSLEMIADIHASSSDRVNRATIWTEINWGDHVEPAPNSQGLSADQAIFLLGLGIVCFLVAVPLARKPSVAEQDGAR